MHYSLLDTPLIRIRLFDDNIKKVCLPEIYAKLVNDEIMGFEALQAHQHQPWFSFLVQLGAMAIARETNGVIPEKPEKWRNALIRLSKGSEEAWHLIVDDISKPAFMQSPVPESSLRTAKYKADIRTPDELDMLVTSKNHDLKRSRIRNPEPENWLFTLITLQTMEGFLGAGNYGIIRMNGGFGHRPFTGIAPGLSWGTRVIRDLKLLVKNRHLLIEQYLSDGHSLLWMLPWDGKKTSAISLETCDPFFIEICRRVRFLLDHEKKIKCLRTTTKASRIFSVEELNGHTGDPWTPIEKKGVKALTLGANGFTYNLLQELLLGDEYQKPWALEFQDEEKNGTLLITQALIRGKGKTEGLHIRVIPIPSQARKVLFKGGDEKDKIARRAKERVNKAGQMQSKVLRPALSLLLGSGEDKKIEYDKIGPWIERFTLAIDSMFFDSLWNSVTQSEIEAKREWGQLLLKNAKKVVGEAEKSLPLSNVRRLKAVSQARGRFYRSARKHFEYLFTTETEPLK